MNAGEDADAPATVQQRLQQRTKLTLMTQFQWGVATYVVSTAAALLLPLFLYSRPDQQTTAVRAVLVLQNLVLWLFLGVLCFIFRCVVGVSSATAAGLRDACVSAHA